MSTHGREGIYACKGTSKENVVECAGVFGEAKCQSTTSILVES